MFAKFDAYISNNFEKFSCWHQKLTGKDCFWLAKMSMFFSVLSLWLIPIIFGNFSIEPKEQYSNINVMSSFLGLAFLFSSFFAIKRIEERAKKFSRSGLANPLKILLSKIRLSLDFLILFTFYFLGISINTNVDSLLFFACMFFYFLFLACGAYFISCNPLPPGTSKVREWINGISFLLNQKKQFET